MTEPNKPIPPIDLSRFQYDIAPRRSPDDPLRHQRSMAWAERFHLAPTAAAKKLIGKIHVDDMSAAIYVDAPPALLDLCTDLLLWFFVSDDQYDERAIGGSPLKMAKVFGNFLRILQTGNEREAISPLGHALLDLRARLCAAGSGKWYERFVSNMELYFDGCMRESRNRAAQRTPEFEEYRLLRRASVGTYPCFDLIEITSSGELPSEVQQNPVLPILRDLASDIIAWVNDIVSYQKESAFSDPHNIVTVLREECGISVAEAVEKTIEFHNEEMQTFQGLAQGIIATGGESARRYVAGLSQWMRGVFDWSFQSERYKQEYLDLSLHSDFVLLHIT